MTEIEKIRECVEKRLSPKRFMHTVGVANEAVKLAKRWNESEESAYVAGLIHDYAKEMAIKDMAEKLKEIEISLEYMHDCPALIHGPLAAHMAKTEFGVKNEDILNAICYHTSGRRNMSRLEKIIYLADFIEPNRSFDGVEIVRKLAYENLDKAVLCEADMTIEFVLKRNQVLHMDTVEMRNELLIKIKEETENEG